MSKNEVRPTNFAPLRLQRRLTHQHKTISYLNSDEDVQAVEDQIEGARKGGISGVPVLIIEGKWAITGGQTRDVYLQVNHLNATILGQSSLVHD